MQPDPPRPFDLYADILHADQTNERGLPLPQCLDGGDGRRKPTGDGVDSRRWLSRRIVVSRNLRRRRACQKRRRVGLCQLSTLEIRIPCVAGTQHGIRTSRIGQLRAARPDRGIAVGEGKHHGFWRQSGQRDNLRSIRGVRCRQLPYGFAIGQRLLPSGHRRKRRSLRAGGLRFAGVAQRLHLLAAKPSRCGSCRIEADDRPQGLKPAELRRNQRKKFLRSPPRPA